MIRSYQKHPRYHGAIWRVIGRLVVPFFVRENQWNELIK
ncbi:hypothetical protein Q7O_002081 [Pectobacterium carotovorum subsp. carotovorum PCCS1]|nr:hypothetical protein [Pectobacterium carotovorum subsp. carotovorum PCCS1]